MNLAASPSPPEQAANGWQASLNCRFERGPERTVVRRSHTGPLAIQRPFYPEQDVAHVYMLHPPGGVVGGDQLKIAVECEPGAAGLLTTPGATKFYRSDGQRAVVEQLLQVNNGSIEWFAQENIFYSGCKVVINNDIRLQADASLAWWEVNCFGRSVDANSKGEQFDHGSVSSVLEIHCDSRMVLRERLVVDEARSLNMSCGLRGCTVSGSLVLTPMQEQCIDLVRDQLQGQAEFTATFFDSLLIVRYLGFSTEEAKDGFVRVWSAMRQSLSQRKPVIPRIWAT